MIILRKLQPTNFHFQFKAHEAATNINSVLQRKTLSVFFLIVPKHQIKKNKHNSHGHQQTMRPPELLLNICNSN